MTEGVISVDANCDILTCNKAAQDIFKFNLDTEPIGKNINSIVKFDAVTVDENESYAVINDSATNVSASLDLLQYHNKYVVGLKSDGADCILHISVNLVTDNSRQMVMVLFKDITEKTNLFKRLDDAILFRSDLVNAIPFPIFWSADGHVIGCNIALEKFLSKSVVDILGMEINAASVFTNFEDLVKIDADMISSECQMPRTVIGKTETSSFVIIKKLSKSRFDNSSAIINIILESVDNSIHTPKIPDLTYQDIYWRSKSDKDSNWISPQIGCNAEILSKVQADDFVFLESKLKTSLTTYQIGSKSVSIYRVKLINDGHFTGSMTGFILR